MANIFLETPTYLSVADLRDSSINVDLADITPIVSDDDVSILIRKSEIIIDSVIGSYGEPVSDTQNTVFPVVDEGIPLAIQKATAILVEQLYQDGVLTSTSQAQSVSGPLVREKYGIHEKEYANNSTTSGKRFSANDKYITDEVYTLLKPYMQGKNNWLISY